jgi:hypothetical protein
MADGEDGGAQPHQHERGQRSALPERDHDRERGCEPEETRAPVQRVAERIVLEELVDEPACRGLVCDRELIRLLRDDAPCESEDRVERCVCDCKRKDQRPRDPGGAAIDSVDEQPERVREPGSFSMLLTSVG